MEFKYLLFATILTLSMDSLCKAMVPLCVEEDKNNATCCPVSENSCPDKYQLVNKTVVCEAKNDSDTTNGTTNSPSTTTVPPEKPNNSTNDTTQSEDMDDSEAVTKQVEVCEICGEHDHFNNTTRKCEKCGDKCLICDRENKDNCTVCLIEHEGKCLSRCPSGTVLSKNKTVNGSGLCDIDKDKDLLIVIIAGAAGGGVVLIIIIVIICCCCFHHRRKQAYGRTGKSERQTAMSIIIQDNANASTIQETGGQPNKEKSKRKNYENMQTKLPGQNEIVNQADVVGRYTRDPTEHERERERKGRKSEHDRLSSPYANHAMVELARTTDLTSVDSKKLEVMVEKEELEQLGQAPVAPAIPVPTSAKPSKTGLAKKLSQRITKLKKGKSKEKLSEDYTPEDYVDMSQKVEPPVAVNAPVTMDMNDGLEDYENFKFSDIKPGRRVPVSRPATSQEAEMEVYENYNQSEASDPMKDLDDYENTMDLRKTDSALPVTAKKPEDNLEDYENTMELRKIDNALPVTAVKAEDDLEDYMNVNALPVTAGETEDDLDDYENVKGLEAYENVDFNQAKGRKARK